LARNPGDCRDDKFTMKKLDVLNRVKNELIFSKGYVLSDVDEHKPWGAYYRLADECAESLLGSIFLGERLGSLGMVAV